MSRYFVSVLIALLALNRQAMAWGKQGHSIIAAIAKSQLPESVIKKVDSYLGGLSWEQTANWMDDHKGGSGGSYMKDWHYINIPKDKTYVKTRTPNVVNQLEYFIKILKNQNMHPPDQITEALRVVFHLVGDIAQPLHCGYNSDKGGTLVNLRFLDRVSNLHRVWDSEIIEEKKMDLWICTKYLMSLSPEDKSTVQKTDVMAWLNESRAYLKDVYDYKDGNIDKAYVEKNASIIQKQLVRAGLRLALILENSFRD